jgi:hypothetical protein
MFVRRFAENMGVLAVRRCWRAGGKDAYGGRNGYQNANQEVQLDSETPKDITNERTENI